MSELAFVLSHYVKVGLINGAWQQVKGPTMYNIYTTNTVGVVCFGWGFDGERSMQW